MIHRAFSIPLNKENFNKEISTIKQIAHNNDIPNTIILNLINKKEKQLLLKSIYPTFKPDSDKHYVSLTYFGAISESIEIILRKLNLSVAFKPYKKLSNCIFNNKDCKNTLNKSGVYKLNCKDCKGVYIGQTGRNFKTRFKEHLRSFKYKKTDSTFACHLLENNHSPDTEIIPIHFANKGLKLTLLESLEIYKHKEDKDYILINDQSDLLYSPLFNSCK